MSNGDKSALAALYGLTGKILLYTAKKHLADKSPALGLYAAAVASTEVFFVFALCKYKPMDIAVLALLLEATASLTSAVLQYVSLYDLISYGGWFPATSAAPYLDVFRNKTFDCGGKLHSVRPRHQKASSQTIGAY